MASVKTLFGYMCSVYLLPTAPMMHERFESKIEHVNGSLMMLEATQTYPLLKNDTAHNANTLVSCQCVVHFTANGDIYFLLVKGSEYDHLDVTLEN